MESASGAISYALRPLIVGQRLAHPADNQELVAVLISEEVIEILSHIHNPWKCPADQIFIALYPRNADLA